LPSPQFVLSFVPELTTRVTNLFHIGPDSVSSVLERPPTLREHGWDLRTLDQAHIVGGEYLELNNGPRKTLRLYEDGTFLARGTIDADFLGWGERGVEISQNPRVHTLAIIEFTTAFVYAYARVMDFLESAPNSLRFRVEIQNGRIDDQFLYIVPFPIKSIGWMDGQNAHPLKDANPKFEGTVTASELRSDPDRVAAALVERLFLFFGVPTNKVPYMTDTDGTRRIDAKRIALI